MAPPILTRNLKSGPSVCGSLYEGSRQPGDLCGLQMTRTLDQPWEMEGKGKERGEQKVIRDRQDPLFDLSNKYIMSISQGLSHS